MPITDYLERNAREYGNDVALVEINPDVQETRKPRIGYSAIIYS